MKVKMKLFHAVAAAMMLTAFPATDAFAAPAKAPAKAPVKKPWRLDVSKMKFVLTTNKNPIQYKVGDDVEFRVIFDWGQEVPEDQKKPMFVQWERSGDDGIRFSGMDPIAPGKDVIIKTKLDRPGFIRFTGRLLDITGKGFVYFKHGEIRTPLPHRGQGHLGGRQTSLQAPRGRYPGSPDLHLPTPYIQPHSSALRSIPDCF